tara:strand:+ start:1692 stop:1904 length:213 start_codon:yes stop_codon:yes gene_type:complete
MNIPKDNLIEFVNLVNECCAVMDHDYVADWLNKPNPDLNMDSPMDVFNLDKNPDRIYRLLYFIDIGEADL